MNKESNKVIYNINIVKVDNGYLMDYVQDNKSHRRVFYSWAELVNWMSEMIPYQDIIPSLLGRG